MKTWINGGFFVLEPEALDDISGDDTVWEREPLEKLSQNLKLPLISTMIFGNQWIP